MYVTPLEIGYITSILTIKIFSVHTIRGVTYIREKNHGYIFFRIIFYLLNEEVKDMRTHIAKETKDKIVKMFYEGYFVWELANLFNISEADVSRILGEAFSRDY